MPNIRSGEMHPVEDKYDLQDPVSEIPPYDEKNPYSMINRVPDWFADRIKDEGVQAYLAMDEEEAFSIIKPTLTIQRLRSSFWLEYERTFRTFDMAKKVQRMQNGVGIQKMCLGICTWPFFLGKVMRSDGYFSWIIRPPLSYERNIELSLEHGLSRVREILSFPLYKQVIGKDGPKLDLNGMPVLVPDEKVANIILKTVAFLDLRAKGGIPQQIHQYTQQKNLNYNVNASEKTPLIDQSVIDISMASIEDIDQKIALISDETEKMLENPAFDIVEKKYVNQLTEESVEREAKENGHGDAFNEE